MKTEAALLVETGKPLVVVSVQTPPLKSGQVLVGIAFSGVCGTQLLDIDGAKGEDKWCPHCLGHEGSGVVIETGSAVTKVKRGDTVVLSWIRGTGIEAGGANYDWDGKTVNAGGVTTFQRHAVVSENRLTLVPPGVDMDVAILLGCAAPTGINAPRNRTSAPEIKGLRIRSIARTPFPRRVAVRNDRRSHAKPASRSGGVALFSEPCLY